MKRLLYILSLLLTAYTSYCYEPPTLQCLQLNNATTLRVTWSNSSDCDHFVAYQFYVNNNLCENYTPTGNFTLCDYGGRDITVAEATSYACYIKALDEDGNLWQSNTLQMPNLQVTASTDSAYAYLSWESPSSDVLDNTTWGSTFQIFKKHYYEAEFPVQPFATVPNTVTSFTDTADVCYNENSYRVSISNRYLIGEDLYNTCPFYTTIGTIFLVDRTQPHTPVLDSVTVEEDNSVALGFHAPDSSMFGYIVYYEGDNGWIAIDTIFNTTYWVDPNGDERCYRIAVLDSCNNCSPMNTDQQCNLNLYVNGTDACNKSASISWSTYPNLSGGIGEYEIFLSTDNGQNYQSLGTTPNNNFTITGLENEVDYRVFVRVYNAAQDLSASSNRKNFNLGPASSTDITYIRSVSVIDNDHIEIKVHTSGDTLPFTKINLERSVDGTNFSTIETLPYHNDAEYIFTDMTADFSKQIYFYRTNVLNNCNTHGGFSNIEHNILLQGTATTAQENELQWTNYGDGPMDVEHYNISRKMENEPTFNDLPVTVSPSMMNTYYDDVADLFENGSKFTYYVTAQIVNDEYGFSDQSVSNHITLQQKPNTYIPNAFTPLGAYNNVFLPKNTFMSGEGYTLIIYYRTGEIAFYTRDPYQGWDGYVNGKLAPTGVYSYKLSYTGPNGKTYLKKGTVTLLR